MLKLSRSLWLLAPVVFAAGCNSTDPDALPVDNKPKTAFDGKVDDRFVGTWVTPEKATYTFTKDGKFLIDQEVKTPAGKQKSHIEGAWGYKEPKMLLKDGAGNVVAYECALQGKTFRLTTTGSLKKETVLTRQ